MDKEALFKDLYKMFLDIAKYVFTAVIISGFFSNFEKGSGLLIGIGFAFVLAIFSVSLIFLSISKKYKK